MPATVPAGSLYIHFPRRENQRGPGGSVICSMSSPSGSWRRSATPVAVGSIVSTGTGMVKSPWNESRSRPPPPRCTIICARVHVVCPARVTLHASRLHLDEQPSPDTVLPSSHCSPGSRMPSPQRGSCWQVAEQPSPDTVLPSSHCSPGSRTPSPQRGSRWQVAEQPSPETVFPSSHVSPKSTTPLPQASIRHVAEQPSPETVLPSSHCSLGSTIPLPHVPATVRQLAPSTVFRIVVLTTGPKTRSMFARPPASRWQ